MGKRCALSRPYAGRGSVRAATAGTVAPSHLLLKFGKLTQKFELLCKETKSPRFQGFGGETSGFGQCGGRCEDEQVRGRGRNSGRWVSERARAVRRVACAKCSVAYVKA